MKPNYTEKGVLLCTTLHSRCEFLRTGVRNAPEEVTPGGAVGPDVGREEPISASGEPLLISFSTSNI